MTYLNQVKNLFAIPRRLKVVIVVVVVIIR
jgi:hypothetical protein